jgi:hypothetical protein
MSVIDLGEEEMSGVELLALYGDDDDRLGSIFSKARDRLRKAARYAVRHSPQRAAYQFAKKHIHGEDAVNAHLAARRVFKGSPEHIHHIRRLYGDDETLGAFLPGLKKIGKFTSGITTGLVRTIGIPQSALDLFSKLDPTAKKKASGSDIANAALVAVQKPVPQKVAVVVPKKAMGMSMKKVAIIGGASVGGVVVLSLLLRSSARAKKAA